MARWKVACCITSLKNTHWRNVLNHSRGLRKRVLQHKAIIKKTLQKHRSVIFSAIRRLRKTRNFIRFPHFANKKMKYANRGSTDRKFAKIQRKITKQKSGGAWFFVGEAKENVKTSFRRKLLITALVRAKKKVLNHEESGTPLWNLQFEAPPPPPLWPV